MTRKALVKAIEAFEAGWPILPDVVLGRHDRSTTDMS